MDTTRLSGREQDITVSRIILHPSYSASSQSHQHDIAVLRLGTPAQLSAFVSTICLPSSTLTVGAGQEVRLAGWGQVAFDSGETFSV